jgi:hypothetical protein
MRFSGLRVFLVVIFVGILSAVSPKAERSSDKSTCSLVGETLKDYQQVRNETTRGEVTKYFVPDGGLQFPAKTRYVYPKCSYFHVDVEFQLLKPSDFSALAGDKVISVSVLYVGIPQKISVKRCAMSDGAASGAPRSRGRSWLLSLTQ